MGPKWGVPLATKSYSDTGASQASRSVNKRPLPETSFYKHSLTRRTQVPELVKRAITPHCQVQIREALVAEPVTSLAG